MTDNANLMAQMMATLGGSTNPQGPVGDAGNIANQWIQNQSQLNMMKQMQGNQALSNMTVADTAGLTPQHMSSIMQTMLGQQGLDQKSLANAYDAMYKVGSLGVQQKQAGTQRVIANRKQAELNRRQAEKLPYKIGGQTVYLSPKEFANASKNTSEYKNYRNTLGPNESPTGQGFKDYQRAMKTLAGEKTPGLLSYGQAKRGLRGRYGKMNSTGQFMITPGLEAANAYAMERFADYS